MAGGRIPQDAVVVQLRGNPGKRAHVKRAREVTPPGRPSMPSWLSKEARAEWRRVVPELDRLGLIAKVDRGVLAAFCDTWGKLEAVARAIDADGATASPRNRGAGAVKNPLWPVYGRLSTQYVMLAGRLGCEPTARARLVVAEAEDEDPDGILD